MNVSEAQKKISHMFDICIVIANGNNSKRE